MVYQLTLTDEVYMYKIIQRVSCLTDRTSVKFTSILTRLWWFFTGQISKKVPMVIKKRNRYCLYITTNSPWLFSRNYVDRMKNYHCFFKLFLLYSRSIESTVWVFFFHDWCLKTKWAFIHQKTSWTVIDKYSTKHAGNG